MLSLRLTIFCLYSAAAGENKGKLAEQGRGYLFLLPPSSPGEALPCLLLCLKSSVPRACRGFVCGRPVFVPPRGGMPGKV